MTQGGRQRARKRRCVAAACCIYPRNRAAVGRLRGMCGATALAHTSESGLCCTRLTVRPCWGDGLGTRPPSLYLSRLTNEGPSWCALAIDPVWGIARRTDHRLPTALSDDGLGDDPPRCPHRRHLYSKLGFTTAAFLPLIIAPMGNLV